MTPLIDTLLSAPATEWFDNDAEEFRKQYAVLQTASDGQGSNTEKSLNQLRAEEEYYESVYGRAKDNFTTVAQKYLQISNLKDDIAKLKEENQRLTKLVDELRTGLQS